MINNVVLQGKLGKDIDLKYTQSGKAVASVSIAVTRDFKDAMEIERPIGSTLCFGAKQLK